MYTGMLIDELFEALERAEKAAAKLLHCPQEIEQPVLVSTGTAAEQSRKLNSETE
jgi:hypothetical protein